MSTRKKKPTPKKSVRRTKIQKVDEKRQAIKDLFAMSYQDVVNIFEANGLIDPTPQSPPHSILEGGCLSES